MLSTFRLPCLAAFVQCALVMLFLTKLTEGRAQNVTVTFNVNMVSVADPDVPHVAGGSDFGVPGDNPMSDLDGDNIWTLTVELPSGYTGYYAFTNGACPDWSCKENIAGQDCAHPENYNDRRLENITENTVINTCFGQCTTDGSCASVGDPVPVTFQVDMSDENTDSGVYMSGTFDGWCGCTPMDDADGDGVYSTTIDCMPGGFLWKFMIGGWGGEEQFEPGGICTQTTNEFTNRYIEVEEGASAIEMEAYCFNSCEACEPEFEGTTVMDIVVGSPDHTTLEAAFIAAELADDLSGSGPFTLFAPTDAAFAALPEGLVDILFAAPTGDLADLLLHHVIGGTALSTDLSNGQVITMVNGTDVTVSIMDGVLMINDATVTVADITADNGVVHVIDVVLIPDPTPNSTVLDILGDSPDHGLLHELTTISEEVYEIFSGGGTVTLFAPTDAAFEALDAGFLDELFSGNGTGEDLLFLHFVDGMFMSDEFYDGLTLNAGGADLTMEVDNGVVTVNNATVVMADIEASNGVIHIIDAVLDPGCSDPAACNYDPNAWSGTATCVYAENCDFCLDGMVLNGDADDDGVCDEDEVAGCTDPLAWNFNPEATDSDAASCVYVPGGCESIGNDNWNAVGLGVHPAELELMFGVEVDEELVLHVPEVLPEPASGALFGVLDFTPTGVSGVPEGLDIGWTADVMEAGSQACLPMTGMPLETGTFTVVWTGDMVFSVFGSPLPVGDFSFEQALTVLLNPNPISGCTYSGSSNFNPVANVDDGGCLFEGCTDPEADNHHPLFNVDDGSCVYGGLGPGDDVCPADLNGDDLVGVGDLLILLGEFGIVCP